MSILKKNRFNICVIGCGYVGLPLIYELSKNFKIIGFDTDKIKINKLNQGLDNTNQLDIIKIRKLKKLFTFDQTKIKDCNVYIVCVPTPINSKKKPNLQHIKSASKIIGNNLNKNDLVIYESTVFPGCTEDICIPILESISKLKEGRDFYCGYSPERVNPGDKKNLLKNTVKIIGSNSHKTTFLMKSIYKKIVKIKNGLHVVKGIKIAEMAKILENVQRSINISLINEFSMICKKINIDTYSVLRAASTKWNFVNYQPGLVGGHCIAIDPYYLSYKAKELKLNPKLTLSGQSINEKIPFQIAKRVISKIDSKKFDKKKILIMGLTFKENCPDIRHSKVFDIISYLNKKKINIEIYEPWLSFEDKKKLSKYKFIENFPQMKKYDAIIIAVAHGQFKKISFSKIKSLIKPKGFIYDVKRIFNRNENFIESL